MSKRLVAPLYLFGLTLILFGPVLAGRIHLETDILSWYYPWRYWQAAAANSCTPLANNLLQDPVFIYCPQDKLLHDSLQRGELPLWDPYSFCGHPLLAVGHPSMTYPLRLLLHRFLSPLLAREMLLWLHMYLSGLFAYMFFRTIGLTRFSSLFGGTVWMLSGYCMAYLEAEYVTLIAAHLPLVFMLVEKAVRHGGRYFAALALALGSLILVGHWQFVMYAMLLSACYAGAAMLHLLVRGWRHPDYRPLFWRRCLGIVAAFAVGLGVAAIQLLPSLELLAQSQRPSLSFGMAFSGCRFLPENLLTLWLADALGNPTHQFWLTRLNSNVQTYRDLCGYIGALPLGLAIVAALHRSRRAAWFILLGLIALLYAMGMPGVTVLFWLVPGFKALAPGRTLFIYTFCATVLSAMGMQAVDRGVFPRHGLTIALAMWSGVTLLFVGFCLWLQYVPSALMRVCRLYAPVNLFALPSYCTDRIAWNTLVVGHVAEHFRLTEPTLLVPLLLGWMGFGVLWLRTHGKVSRALFRAVCLLAVSADLLYFGVRYNVTFPAASAYPPTPATSYLTADGDGPYRCAGVIRPMHADVPTLYGIQDVAGYASLFPKRYLMLMQNLAMDPQLYLMVDLANGSNYGRPLMSLLNVRYHYTDPLHDLPPTYGTEVYHRDLRIYRNSLALPRYFLAARAQVVASPEQELADILSPAFRPREVVYLEEPVAQAGSGKGVGEVRTVRYEPNHVELEVEAAGDCWLVGSDCWYPGWQAQLDGQAAPLYRADYCFRGMFMPAGRHRVRLDFRPLSFRAGLAISLGCLLLCLIGLLAG